jgi:lysophospholipase L1-like esterase
LRLAADVHEVAYVDTIKLFSGHDHKNKLLAEDGYHPNALGHAVLHGAIKQELAGIGIMPGEVIH